MAQSMKHQHTTEVPIGSKFFKWVQEMIDETCLSKMCGYGRDMRHKQSTKQKKKRIPYNRMEAVRVYELNNSLRYITQNSLLTFFCAGHNVYIYLDVRNKDRKDVHTHKSKEFPTLLV